MNNKRVSEIQNQLPSVLIELNKQLGLPEDSGYLNIVFNLDDNIWRVIEGYSNYQRNTETNHVRNKRTFRILTPNNSGFVKIKSNQGQWTHISTKPNYSND